MYMNQILMTLWKKNLPMRLFHCYVYINPDRHSMCGLLLMFCEHTVIVNVFLGSDILLLIDCSSVVDSNSWEDVSGFKHKARLPFLLLLCKFWESLVLFFISVYFCLKYG